MSPPLKRIEDLLALLLDEDELRILFAHLSLADALPNKATPSALRFEAAAILYRRGRIDGEFFDQLLARAGNHGKLVREVARDFGVNTRLEPPLIERPGGRPHVRTTRLHATEATLVVASMVIPVVVGLSRNGAADLYLSLLASFLIGPIAMAALILERRIEFAGSLLIGVKLLDRATLFPLGAAVAASGLGATATLLAWRPAVPATQPLRVSGAENDFSELAIFRSPIEQPRGEDHGARPTGAALRSARSMNARGIRPRLEAPNTQNIPGSLDDRSADLAGLLKRVASVCLPPELSGVRVGVHVHVDEETGVIGQIESNPGENDPEMPTKSFISCLEGDLVGKTTTSSTGTYILGSWQASDVEIAGQTRAFRSKSGHHNVRIYRH